MEPERPIEKELRAYAEKRKAAGASAEMPAARRKLLLEQAERLAKGGGAPAWWQVLRNSWPRLMVAGGAVAVVAVIIGFLLPSRNDRREYFQSAKELVRNEAADFKKQPLDAEKTAPNSTATRALRPEVPMVINSPKSTTRSTPPTVDKINEPAPMLADVPASAPAPVAAPATPPTATFGGGAVSGAVALKNRTSKTEELSLTFDDGRREPAIGRPGAPPPAFSPKLDADRTKDTSAKTAAQPFYRIYAPPAGGEAGAVAAASNVLGSFRVEQAMGKLRIIDGDGSVYTGFVDQKPEAAKPSAAQKKREAKDKADLATVSGEQIQTPRRYYFRVAGTNRTLKENVVFSGNFLISANLGSSPPADALNESFAAGVPASLPLELRRARLEGSLLLGKTNKIEIYAAPTKP